MIPIFRQGGNILLDVFDVREQKTAIFAGSSVFLVKTNTMHTVIQNSRGLSSADSIASGLVSVYL